MCFIPAEKFNFVRLAPQREPWVRKISTRTYHTKAACDDYVDKTCFVFLIGLGPQRMARGGGPHSAEGRGRPYHPGLLVSGSSRVLKRRAGRGRHRLRNGMLMSGAQQMPSPSAWVGGGYPPIPPDFGRPREHHESTDCAPECPTEPRLEGGIPASLATHIYGATALSTFSCVGQLESPPPGLKSGSSRPAPPGVQGASLGRPLQPLGRRRPEVALRRGRRPPSELQVCVGFQGRMGAEHSAL